MNKRNTLNKLKKVWNYFIKLHTYDFYSSGTTALADVEFVKSAMEEALRKIKNYKII